MTEDVQEEHRMYAVAKNRFTILIIGSITVALLLVMISLFLYGVSGAAQVDLSGPGYSSVRSEVTEDRDSFEAFPGTGPINKEALALFDRLYTQTTQAATKSEVFHNDVISDRALRITNEDLSLQNY